MKPFFKPEDFHDDVRGCLPTAIAVSTLANAKVDSDGVRVRCMRSGDKWIGAESEGEVCGSTHTGILLITGPIEKEVKCIADHDALARHGIRLPIKGNQTIQMVVHECPNCGLDFSYGKQVGQS